jgi:hypothetical protein
MKTSTDFTQESLMQKSHRLARWKQGERYRFHYEMVLPALPGEVFPLLCPILEYDWLNGWNCTMIFSESGVAEDNCIFYNSTGFPLYKKKIFQVIDYRQGEHIEFLIFINRIGSIRFSLGLKEMEGNRTLMLCNYLLTGHTRMGNKQFKRFREKQIEKDVKKLEADLIYWLRNKRLRKG